MAINNIDGIPFLWDNDAHLPLDERLKAWEQKFGNGQNSPLNSSSGFESLLKTSSKEVARNSAFGKDSIFYEPEPLTQNNFRGKFYTDEIDFHKLALDLRAKLSTGDLDSIIKYISTKTEIAFQDFVAILGGFIKSTNPNDL
ncbi:MAG: hypothetical protein IPI52_05515 [Bacteroidetes bacterium]|nr:hypothetical protein [Bacteroidota bacterium]